MNKKVIAQIFNESYMKETSYSGSFYQGNLTYPDSKEDLFEEVISELFPEG